MLYYFFLLSYAIIDITDEKIIYKIVLKSIIAFFASIPVFVSIILFIGIQGLKWKYFLQQFFLVINKDLGKYIIKKCNYFKGCDFNNDYIIKKNYFDKCSKFIIYENLDRQDKTYIKNIDKDYTFISNNFYNNVEIINECRKFKCTMNNENIILTGKFWYFKNKGLFAIRDPIQQQSSNNNYLTYLYILRKTKLEDFLKFMQSNKYILIYKPNFIQEGTVKLLNFSEKLKILNSCSSLYIENNNLNIGRNEFSDNYSNAISSLELKKMIKVFIGYKFKYNIVKLLKF
jgi:hypothetical protein